MPRDIHPIAITALGVALFHLASSGCFDPKIAEVRCSSLGECPVGTLCDVDGVCRAPNDISPDAAPDGPRTVGSAFTATHLESEVADFGSTDLVAAADLQIDTSAGRVGSPFDLSLLLTEQPGGGPGVAVLIVRSFEVNEDVTVTVRGSRPLIIVSENAIIVRGVIDASAVAAEPGPGAAQQGAGTPGGSDGTLFGAGGGGGFATEGGTGGTTQSANGGPGGIKAFDQTLAVLIGGSPGGSAAVGVDCERLGGGGGGAVQISTPAQIVVSGAITVGGGGGRPGGPCPAGRGGPGSGGGSGGAIFLEALQIQVSGALIANGGGGGGGGGDDNNQDGEPGADGSALAEVVSGGDGGDNSGDGGNGGTTSPPTNGEGSNSRRGGGGGGGGSAGKIVIIGEFTATDGALTTPAAVLSE